MSGPHRNVNPKLDKPSKTYLSDQIRVCDDPECQVYLSIYNSTKYCYVHERKYSLVNKFI